MALLEDLYVVATDHGAVPNDGTDQTGPLQDALALGASTGKPVLLPPGVFHVQSLRPRGGNRLRGVGDLSVLRRLDGSTADVLWCRKDEDDVVIRDLAIDGHSAQGGPLGQGAVVVQGHGVTLHRVKAVDVHAFAIRVVQANECTIDDCDVTSSSEKAAIVFHGGGGGGVWSDFTVRNSRIDKSSSLDGAGIATAINQAGANALRGVDISGNRVRGAAGAICIETYVGLGDQELSDLTMRGNRTTGGTMGLSVPGTIGGSLMGNVHRWDGTQPGSGTWGIELVNCRHVACVGNSVYGTNTGVTVNSSEGCAVVANTLVDIGQVNGVESFAVSSYNATALGRNNIIADNIIRDCRGIGIIVRGDQGGFIVEGNNLDGIEGNAAIQWGGAGATSGRVNCQGNTIRNSQFGIRFKWPVQFTGVVTGNDMLDNVATPIVTEYGADLSELVMHSNPGVT